MEDAAFLAFELAGTFNINMTAGVESAWDVWNWKAGRTDPAGYAMDRRHLYTRTEPQGKSAKIRCLDGNDGWIQRPEDAGRTVTGKHPAPSERKGDVEPQYAAQEPDGSAADVRAKGSWKDGVWTVEFSRKLDTGHEDDARFEAGGARGIAIGIQRESEDEAHLASMPYTLQLEK